MGMKIFRNKLLFFTLGILLSSTTVFGQGRADTLKQKHNESVTIYGNSRPVTGEALKIGRKPQLPMLQMSTAPLSSHFADIKVPTTIRLKQIRPASNIPTTQQELPWKNLLTLGLGSRISPLLEYFYSGREAKTLPADGSFVASLLFSKYQKLPAFAIYILKNRH